MIKKFIRKVKGFATSEIEKKQYINIIRNAKRSGILPEKLPIKSASLSFTENCNARCITCDQWKNQKSLDLHLSADKWKKIISDLVDIGVKQLYLTGGEPLLFKGIFDVTSFAKERGIKTIRLQTNGLLLKKYLSELGESGITHINVSVGGFGKTNDVVRGVSGYFDNVMEYLPQVKISNKHLSLILLKGCSDDVIKIKKICEDNNWGLGFNLPDNRLYFDNHELNSFPDEYEINEVLKLFKYSSLQKEYIKKYMLLQGKDSNPVCIVGLKKIYIGYSGNVYSGCYVLPTMGNLREQSIKELINSNQYKERLIKMIKHNCPGCSCGYKVNLPYSNFDI